MNHEASLAVSLFDNHLAFMSSHRGTRIDTDDWICIEGARPDLTCWIPKTCESQVPDACAAVRQPPTASEDWVGRQLLGRFLQEATLAYMVYVGEDGPIVSSPPSIEVDVVNTAEKAVEFAAVQAAGFATGMRVVDSWWRTFFEAMALRNYGEQTQSFYLARTNGTAVACLLTVETPPIVGIYATATLPQYRRRGIATELLRQVRHGVGARATLALQAFSGSSAESLYLKRGFRCEARLPLWRRITSPQP